METTVTTLNFPKCFPKASNNFSWNQKYLKAFRKILLHMHLLFLPLVHITVIEETDVQVNKKKTLYLDTETETTLTLEEPKIE